MPIPAAIKQLSRHFGPFHSNCDPVVSMNSTPNGTKSNTVGTSVIHELEVVSGHWAKAKPTNKKIIAQFNFIVHLHVLLFSPE